MSSENNLDWGGFIQQLVDIKYSFISRTGREPKKIIISRQIAKQFEIEDIIEIIGFPIEISENLQDGQIQVQCGQTQWKKS